MSVVESSPNMRRPKVAFGYPTRVQGQEKEGKETKVYCVINLPFLPSRELYPDVAGMAS